MVRYGNETLLGEITKLVIGDSMLCISLRLHIGRGQHRKTKSFIQEMTLSKNLMRRLLLVHMDNLHSKIFIKSLVYCNMFFF